MMTRCSSWSRSAGAERWDHVLEALRRGRDARDAARAHEHRHVVPAGAGRAGRPIRRTSAFAGVRTYKAVDTCAAEFAASTPYFYSGLGAPAGRTGPMHEAVPSDRPSVVILGSGPNRIGQGIEFDYCCVHAAETVRELGRDAVMINCNPETVSTDYDTSDRLYFEPLTLEDVIAVCELEQPEGVVVQFGGQTPLKLAAGPGRGRHPDPRHQHRRDRPGRGSLALRRRCWTASATRPRRTRPRPAPRRRWPAPPRSASRCWCAPATCSAAGRWRSSTASRACATTWSGSRPIATRAPEIYLDRFLEDAIEVDVDALCDGEDVLDRRDHAARRGGRHPLRRLGLRAAAAHARRGDARARSASRRPGSPARSGWSGCSTSSSPSTARTACT